MTANLEGARKLAANLKGRLNHAIRGRGEVIDLLLVALLADGHVLLEDYPGSGKTTLAKALGESIHDDSPGEHIAAFRRIQFTPDLLPSDITGVAVFDAETSGFHFRPGPIFAHVVLADEINRTSPKVQAAMLEAMAEKQVSADNISHPLDELFFVIATQNPRDQVGTYPLPVAQLDRFLFKIVMEHIDREAELDVLRSYKERRKPPANDTFPAVMRSQVMAARAAVDDQIHLAPAIQDCLVDIAQALRSSPQVAQGISTRSLVLMMPALQAAALLRDRGYVVGEDIEWLAPHVFGHRIELAPGVENARKVIKECCKPALEKLSRATLRP
ncbi:MAG: AAA family ATPase [Vulcanimicrobiota bacterium]